jgi:flagellar biosynthesis GTPase FlhF
VTLNQEYTATARRPEEVAAEVTNAWAENIQKSTDQLRTPVLPAWPIDPTAFVEQWFDFSDRLTRVNRQYVVNLTSTLDSLSGAVRQHIDGLGDAVRDQVQAVSQSTKDQLEKVADAEREHAEQAQEEEREQARATRNAERQKARKERQVAYERYQDMNKSELADELASRELPKSGTVDELIERLVDADTK